MEISKFKDRVLIFGGPYSNLAATQAMRARAAQLGIEPQRVICSGDIVAYCGEPAETVEAIRDWGIRVVMGNCEESLAYGEGDCGCGFEPGSSCQYLAQTWFGYADARVTPAQRRWMRSLPRAIDFELNARRFRVVHGSPDKINEFVFASSDSARKLAQICAAGVDAIVGGHSGIPFGQRIDDRAWLNAGVIGMPANDGGRHGWYMLLEPSADGVEASWQRLEYEFVPSWESTRAAGMPEYARALADGLWPSMDILPAAERTRRGRRLELPPLRI